MTEAATTDAYGTLTGPATLTIERLLPGPAERVWAFLTESDKRRRWLASGAMATAAGGPLELVWRNDELTDPPGERPEGMSAEQRMQGRMIEVDPPHRLAFDWPGVGEVTFVLTPKGKEVLLTLTHRRIPGRSIQLSVSAGWHCHLDLLVAAMTGSKPARPHWDHWRELRKEYERRMPA